MAVHQLQRLRSLERLESLDIAYVNVGTYSMRLHTVRLTELLFLPRLRRLRLLVPGLHDAADAAAFLGANFVRQLREGCLQHLDITLLSEDDSEPLLGFPVDGPRLPPYTHPFVRDHFMRYLCEGCLQHLDITLLSEDSKPLLGLYNMALRPQSLHSSSAHCSVQGVGILLLVDSAMQTYQNICD